MLSCVLNIHNICLILFLVALTNRKQSFGAGDKKFVGGIKTAKGPKQHKGRGNCSSGNTFKEGTLLCSPFIFCAMNACSYHYFKCSVSQVILIL